MADDLDSDQSVEIQEQGPDHKKPLIKWGWLRVLVYIIVWPAVNIGLGIILNLNPEERSMGDLARGPELVYLTALNLVVNILLIAAFRRFIDRKSIKSLGLSFGREQARHLVYGLLTGIAIIASVFFILLAIGSIEIVKIQYPGLPIFYVLASFVMVGFYEEFQSRGYMMNNLMDSFNPYLALLLTSLLFALGHITNPHATAISTINIIFAGLVLGIYYVHKVNLWYPIGIHITWNLFEGSIFGSAVSGHDLPSLIKIKQSGSTLISGGSFGFEASLVTVFVLIITTLIIHTILRRKRAGTA